MGGTSLIGAAATVYAAQIAAVLAFQRGRETSARGTAAGASINTGKTSSAINGCSSGRRSAAHAAPTSANFKIAGNASGKRDRGFSAAISAMAGKRGGAGSEIVRRASDAVGSGAATTAIRNASARINASPMARDDFKVTAGNGLAREIATKNVFKRGGGTAIDLAMSVRPTMGSTSTPTALKRGASSASKANAKTTGRRAESTTRTAVSSGSKPTTKIENRKAVRANRGAHLGTSGRKAATFGGGSSIF